MSGLTLVKILVQEQNSSVTCNGLRFNAIFHLCSLLMLMTPSCTSLSPLACTHATPQEGSELKGPVVCKLLVVCSMKGDCSQNECACLSTYGCSFCYISLLVVESLQ